MEKGCRKCGSVDMTSQKQGTNTGLYCNDCGAWQKWLSKDEIRLIEFQNKTLLGTASNQQLKDKFNELEIAVQPLIEFMNKYYDPMSYAVLTEGRCEILRNDMGIALKVRD